MVDPSFMLCFACIFLPLISIGLSSQQCYSLFQWDDASAIFVWPNWKMNKKLFYVDIYVPHCYACFMMYRNNKGPAVKTCINWLFCSQVNVMTSLLLHQKPNHVRVFWLLVIYYKPSARVLILFLLKFLRIFGT